MTDLRDRFLREIHSSLDEHLGTPSTGKSVAYRYLELGRQLGKTTMMLKQLKDGSIVFCQNSTLKRVVTDYIRQHGISNCHVFVAKRLSDIKDNLIGISYTPENVYVDNAIFDQELEDIIVDFYTHQI